jgi:uncharacterized ferritin-like protein (DUF455 family)
VRVQKKEKGKIFVDNFFEQLENIIVANTPEKKFELFDEFYNEYKKAKNVIFTCKEKPKIFENPSYSDFLHVVKARDVAKRTKLTTSKGQIYLLHAIAHIEYSAIDLALDACYRFYDMPKEYYDDWLEVAEDEIRHFKIIESLLKDIGGYYGCESVHDALFEASYKTQSLLERMAIVPRFLEANGLDATPQVLKRLSNIPQSEFIKQIKDALHVILEEEVDHVKKGDRWFLYACEKEDVEKSIYFDIVEKYYPDTFPKNKQLNV